MSSSAIIMMVAVQLTVASFTIYFFYRVLKKPIVNDDETEN